MEDNGLILIDRNATHETEKEILFVSKELFDTVKALGEIEGIKAQVKKSYANFIDEIELDTKYIEEAVKRLKKTSGEVKEELESTIENEISILYEVYEKLDDKRSEMKQKVLEMSKSINDVKVDLIALRKEISELSIYGLSQLIELVEKINYMPEKDKELLACIFEVYKNK